MSESTPTEISFGWLRELPSIKNYTTEHAEIKPLLAKVHGAGAVSASASLAASVDLRA